MPSHAVPAQAEPSWARVLATTVKLRVGRLRRRGQLYRPVAWRWRVATLALALALGVVAALQFAGVFTRTASPAAPSPAGRVPSAAAQSQAAAWIASQVSANAIIACYPVMCAALQAQGVMAGRLMPVRPGTADPAGANVMVTSPSVSSKYAPALIASFGSGGARIDIRATEPGGAAAYASALRADLAARKSAGSELLRNWHIKFTAQDAARLRAGEVDSRLLATLAALAAQYSFRVTAFGDASPGAQVPLRGVTITASGQSGTAGLAAALALVREQSGPYLPAHAALLHPATVPTLSIEFAAPGPLGLLTAVLADNQQHAAAHTAAIAGAFPLGWAWIS